MSRLFWRWRPSTSPEAEHRYFATEIGARLNAALEKLSPRQRAVFTLRHFEDMSLEEIGDVLDLDVGTVKAHMFRAVAKLRDRVARPLWRDQMNGHLRTTN